MSGMACTAMIQPVRYRVLLAQSFNIRFYDVVGVYYDACC